MRRILIYIAILGILGNGMQSARAETLVGPAIINGFEATPNEFPFMAYLHYSSFFAPQRCGGALINPQWILTAAHCVNGMAASNIKVTMGVHYATYLSANLLAQNRAIKRIIVHPQYNATIYDYDIALLELDTSDADPAAADDNPLTLNAAVAPARVASLPAADALYADDHWLTVSGWGTTENGRQSSYLRKVNVPVVSNRRCEPNYLALDPPNPITARMMCAGDMLYGGIDACQGDSGGPLFGTIDGQFVIVGIVSSGEGCAERDYAGIYTHVAFFHDWIEGYTGALTPLPTAVPTITPNPAYTATQTALPTMSRTAIRSLTPSQTPVVTNTLSATATKASATPSRTVTRSQTRTATVYRTATKSRTPTSTPRATATKSRTRTAAPSKTRTRTPTRSLIPTATSVAPIVSP